MLLEVHSIESKRAYAADTFIFLRWLEEQQLELSQVDYDTLLLYREYLLDTWSQSTAKRRIAALRQFFTVALRHGLITTNHAKDIKIKTHADESSPHTALSKSEAKKLLASVDRATLIGKRDYALLMLLIFGGVRRSECAHITLADITSKQEHKVLTIQHGKGNKRRDIPLRPDVFRAIYSYLESVDRLDDSPDSSLFTGFTSGYHATDQGISSKTVEHVVKRYAAIIGMKITPHDLRASAITFWSDTNAPLIMVQRLAGHSSPVTTERYVSRKANLDNSPVYKVDLDA